MDKHDVNRNVKHSDKPVDGGWLEALNDAEEGIKKANRELSDWKAVAAICRKRITEKAAWPGESATRN